MRNKFAKILLKIAGTEDSFKPQPEILNNSGVEILVGVSVR